MTKQSTDICNLYVPYKGICMAVHEITNITLPYTTYFLDTSASVITDKSAHLHGTDYRYFWAPPHRTAKGVYAAHRAEFGIIWRETAGVLLFREIVYELSLLEGY